MSDLTSLSIAELSRKLKAGDASSEEATKAYLERIKSVDKKLNCYLTVNEEAALKMARDADERIKKGDDVTALTGVPIGLKDIFLTKGMKTTCASKILNNFIPPFDGTPVKRLRDAGAVFLGKLNMDEFAMGSSSENSSMGPVRNPWDTERIPGGSSGGSAAAVAARLCAGALGTDTGGSIRQPASLCGIVGMKPTYGRVSRYGVIAFASSLDQVGPMARTVEDNAILLQCIAGHDPMDSTSVPSEPQDYTAALNEEIKGMKIGVPKEYFIEGIDPEVEKSVKDAIELLKEQGAEVLDVSLPHTDYAIATYYIIATAEASSNLARYDGVKYGYRAENIAGAQHAVPLMDMYKRTRTEGFGPEVKRRIMLGTYVLSAGYYDAYYRKAMQVRTLIRQDFEKVFETCDIIVTPTSPTPAFKLGEKLEDPLTMYLSDIFTASLNLAGLGGLSVPCGLTKSKLPIGLQFISSAFDEPTLFHAAHAYEKARGGEFVPTKL